MRNEILYKKSGMGYPIKEDLEETKKDRYKSDNCLRRNKEAKKAI